MSGSWGSWDWLHQLQGSGGPRPQYQYLVDEAFPKAKNVYRVVLHCRGQNPRAAATKMEIRWELETAQEGPDRKIPVEVYLHYFSGDQAATQRWLKGYLGTPGTNKTDTARLHVYNEYHQWFPWSYYQSVYRFEHNLIEANVERYIP